jgi:hypothetical protein
VTLQSDLKEGTSRVVSSSDKHSLNEQEFEVVPSGINNVKQIRTGEGSGQVKFEFCSSLLRTVPLYPYLSVTGGRVSGLWNGQHHKEAFAQDESLRVKVCVHHERGASDESGAAKRAKVGISLGEKESAMELAGMF